MFEIVYDDDDGRTTDGRRLDGYPISSPCEPNGSDELKTFQNGPKSFLSRTKLRESVGNAKQSIFYFRPEQRIS